MSKSATETTELSKFSLGYIVISLVAFIFWITSECFQWKWTLVPPVRLIIHVVAAILGTIFLCWIALVWAEINKVLMGIWIIFIGWMNAIDPKKIKLVKLINTYFFRFVQPLAGAGMYILISYVWERDQALYYNRPFQHEQFVVDIVFAIVGSFIWFIAYNEFAIDNNYLQSNKDWIKTIRRKMHPEWTQDLYYFDEDDFFYEDTKVTELWMLILTIILLVLPLILFVLNAEAVILYLQ